MAADASEQKKAGTAAEAKPAGEQISIDEFFRVELRVAAVCAAEPVEGADRLLKLQIDLGSEQRQLVAGIAKRYAPGDLVGRKIVVVTNLKPARIRGVESQGMLLAAVDENGDPVLATFAEPVPVGAKIR
jgi:methionyl-tRNA synthetase